MTLQNLGAYPYPSNRGYNVRGSARGASAVYHQQWINPAILDADGYKTTFAGPNTTTFEFGVGTGLNGALVVGAVAKPDVPRNVVITVTHGSAVVAESGVITGLDLYGRVITEAWSVTAGGTSKVFTGRKAFARVTLVTVTAASDASANSNTIGTGVVLGLDVKCSVGGTGAGVKELVDGAIVTTGVVVAASAAAADDARGTYDPATDPDGAHDYDLWFISDDPEAS